jgi:hypothetical protein
VSEVTDLIAALRAGELSVGEVAEVFRHRRWPTRGRPEPESYLEMAARTLEDPEPDMPGSYDEVSAAYYRREITSEQYQVLSDAVAEAIRAQSRDPAEGI